jgi:hypothetical protein
MVREAVERAEEQRDAGEVHAEATSGRSRGRRLCSRVRPSADAVVPQRIGAFSRRTAAQRRDWLDGAPWRTNGCPNSLRCGGAAPVGGDARHLGATRARRSEQRHAWSGKRRKQLLLLDEVSQGIRGAW